MPCAACCLGSSKTTNQPTTRTKQMLNHEQATRNGHAPMIFNPAAFKAKRRSLGWTQKRAADWFELSAPAIGHWETGSTVPIEKNWAKIMEFMGLGGEQLPVPVPVADHPEWWPSASPEHFFLRRVDAPRLRIKGWWLGNAEGQSPNGSEAEAKLFLTESGTTFVEIYYVSSAKSYVTHGSFEYVLGRMSALPWAKALVVERGVDAWEDY